MPEQNPLRWEDRGRAHEVLERFVERSAGATGAGGGETWPWFAGLALALGTVGSVILGLRWESVVLFVAALVQVGGLAILAVWGVVSASPTRGDARKREAIVTLLERLAASGPVQVTRLAADLRPLAQSQSEDPSEARQRNLKVQWLELDVVFAGGMTLSMRAQTRWDLDRPAGGAATGGVAVAAGVMVAGVVGGAVAYAATRSQRKGGERTTERGREGLELRIAPGPGGRLADRARDRLAAATVGDPDLELVAAELQRGGVEAVYEGGVFLRTHVAGRGWQETDMEGVLTGERLVRVVEAAMAAAGV